MSMIHGSIKTAMAEIAKTGIAKISRNKDQSYNFRGIEAAMNEMCPVLIRAGIIVSPSYSELTVHERQARAAERCGL